MKVIFVIIIFLSLTNTRTRAQVDQNFIEPASDTLIIAETTAILFHPDSLLIEELKREKGLEDFYFIAEDAMWYVAQSREFLEERGIKIVDTEMKFVKFKFDNGRTTTLQTDSLEPIWGLILFNGEKQPMVTYPVDVSYDYELYFEKE